MSKASIDKMLGKALKITNDKWVREALRQNWHEVTITRANLRNAYIDAFNIEHTSKDREASNPFGTDTEKMRVFNAAATHGLNRLKAHLESGRSKGTLLYSTRDKVVFSSIKDYPTPYTTLKKAGVEILNKELKKVGGRELSAKQQQGIETSIHKLHAITTVGIARLAYTLEYLERSGTIDGFFKSKQYTHITNKYGDLKATFEIDQDAPSKKERIKLKADLMVALTIGSRSINKPGTEANDWTQIRPYLLKKLSTWLKQEKLENLQGSKSIKQKANINVENLIIDELLQIKKAKLKRPKKPKENYSRKKQERSIEKKRLNRNVPEKRPRDPRTGRFISKEQVQTPINLLAILNAKLPEYVARNMILPALRYRTGRFANSVRAINVNQTREGFPSIGYTYQKFPYQTFEPGFAQGSEDRDPRKLIDKSIREIAAEIQLGRFYTRRI